MRNKSKEKEYVVILSRDYTHAKRVVIHAESEEAAHEIGMEMIDNVELELDCAVPDSDDAEVMGDMFGDRDRSTRLSELHKLYHNDNIAVEMARRKLAFHLNEKWNSIELWGLFKYNKALQAYFDDGRLLNKMNYKPENKTYWVQPSKEYWENSIKPICENFTLEDLHKTFYW